MQATAKILLTCIVFGSASANPCLNDGLSTCETGTARTGKMLLQKEGATMKRTTSFEDMRPAANSYDGAAPLNIQVATIEREVESLKVTVQDLEDNVGNVVESGQSTELALENSAVEDAAYTALLEQSKSVDPEQALKNRVTTLELAVGDLLSRTSALEAEVLGRETDVSLLSIVDEEGAPGAHQVPTAHKSVAASGLVGKQKKTATTLKARVAKIQEQVYDLKGRSSVLQNEVIG